MNRKQPIKVGNLVWIEQCKANDLLSELPEGLSDGIQVRVLDYSQGKSVKIQTEDGRVFNVDPIHIDTGWLFLLGGKQFGEHTSRAKAYIKRMVGEIARNVHPRYPDLAQAQIVQWRGILARNGAA